MTAQDPNGNVPMPSLSREDLLKKLQSVGIMPFFQRVVQSPTHPVIDVPSLHKEAKDRIKKVIQGCQEPNAVRCFTFHAPPGYGKTHLLSWTRQYLEQQEDLNTLFIYVPPYLAGGKPLENHLLESTYQALWISSQRDKLITPVHQLLVNSYDHVIKERKKIGDLKIPRTWANFFAKILWYSSLKISGKSKDDQTNAIERSFRRRTVLKQAFDKFQRTHSSKVAGISVDWDAFVASCLLARGESLHRDCANRWFRDDPTLPPEILESCYLEQTCQGWQKIRNVLFTLTCLSGLSFCFALDQMENTFHSLNNAGNLPEELLNMGTIVDDLCKTPGFCMLFSFQASEWQLFKRTASPFLRDRMEEGDGTLDLQAISDADAFAVVTERMKHIAWNNLAPLKPPPTEPLFPFSEEEVRQIRLDADSELREFMKILHSRYLSILKNGEPSRPTVHLKITKIEPQEVLSHEPTPIRIYVDHLPPDVDVYFGKEKASQVVCRPEKGHVEVNTPTKLSGEVTVMVQAADNADNKDSYFSMFFAKILAKKPYSQHLDREKFKECRKQKGYTQKRVGNEIAKPHHYISNFETGKINPPDEFFEALAKVYDSPLSAFMKSTSKAKSS